MICLWPPTDCVHKADANDTRETPAIRICRNLLEEGAQLVIFDPKVSAGQIAADLGVEHASSQQILVRRPDLFPAVQTILLERLPLLTRKDLMEIATIPSKELRHTRVAQEWIEEGRQEGEAQGEARGRAAEAAAVTLRQLNRRCGPLSDATTAEIQALPLEHLEALAEALLDFSGPQDLTTWLAEHNG